MLDFLMAAALTLPAFAGAPPAVKFEKYEAKEVPAFLREQHRQLEAEAKAGTTAGLDPSLAALTTTVARPDLNGDGRAELCASFASYALAGNAGAELYCYEQTAGGAWREILKAAAAPETLAVTGERSAGYADLTVGGPGVSRPHVWRWNGKAYR